MCCDVIEENQKIIFSSGWQLDVNGSNDCMSTSTSSVSSVAHLHRSSGSYFISTSYHEHAIRVNEVLFRPL